MICQPPGVEGSPVGDPDYDFDARGSPIFSFNIAAAKVRIQLGCPMDMLAALRIDTGEQWGISTE